MNEICCTVHLRKLLTIRACQYYLLHVHEKTWILPLTFSILFIITSRICSYLCAPEAPSPGILDPMDLLFAFLIVYILISLMPLSIRSHTLSLMRYNKIDISRPIPVRVTPKGIFFPTGSYLMHVPDPGEHPWHIQYKRKKDRGLPGQPFNKAVAVYVSPHGIFFKHIYFMAAFFIGREDLSPEQFSALCEMLKEVYGDRYYEI